MSDTIALGGKSISKTPDWWANMDLLDPKMEIEFLDKDVGSKSLQIDTINFLIRKYTDLKLFRVHDGYIYCAGSINRAADKVSYTEVEKSPDQPLSIYAWPHIVDDGFTIFTNPPFIQIASVFERGFGLQPEPKWEDLLESMDLPFTILRDIRNYLSGKPPISYLD